MPGKKELIDRLSEQAKKLLIQEATDAADLFFTDEDLMRLTKSIIKTVARELRDAGLKEVRSRQSEITEQFMASVMPTAEQHLNEQIGLCAERIERMAESAKRALSAKAEEIAEKASRDCVDEAVRQTETAMAEAVDEMRSELRELASKTMIEWTAEWSAQMREARRTEMEGLLKEETERISAEAERQCAEAVEADREFIRRTADRAVALLRRTSAERLNGRPAVAATTEGPNEHLLQWSPVAEAAVEENGTVKSAVALPNGHVGLVVRDGDQDNTLIVDGISEQKVRLYQTATCGDNCELIRVDGESPKTDLLAYGKRDSNIFVKNPKTGWELIISGNLVSCSNDSKNPILLTAETDESLYRIHQISDESAQELGEFKPNILPSGHAPFAVTAGPDGFPLVVAAHNSGKSLSVWQCRDGEVPTGTMNEIELPFMPDRYAPFGQVFLSGDGSRLYVPYSGLLEARGAIAEVRLAGERIDSVRIAELEDGQQGILSARFDRETDRLCLSTWGKGEAQVTVFDLNLMASLGTVFRRSFDRFTRVVADMRGTDVVVALGGGEEKAELALYALA